MLVPTDPGWVKHASRTCPGDAAQGICPGRDFVEVRQEFARFALLNISRVRTNLTMLMKMVKLFYPDDETDSH